MAINGLALTNSLTLNRIEPAITYPVQPVPKIKSLTSKSSLNMSSSINKKDMELKDKFSSFTLLKYDESNPYEVTRKGSDYALVSGLNFDEYV